MIYILSILFVLLYFVVGIKILEQFRDGFNWFSGIIYLIIFLVSCWLLYVTIFGPYYAVIQ